MHFIYFINELTQFLLLLFGTARLQYFDEIKKVSQYVEKDFVVFVIGPQSQSDGRGALGELVRPYLVVGIEIGAKGNQLGDLLAEPIAPHQPAVRQLLMRFGLA